MAKKDHITKQPDATRGAPHGRTALAHQMPEFSSGSSRSRASTSQTCSAVLPRVGKSRWQQLKDYVPVSRETWRKLVREKRAPQPERISERCTVYDNGEMHRWFADPANYRA